MQTSIVLIVSNKGIPCIHVPKIILYTTLQNSDNSNKVYCSNVVKNGSRETAIETRIETGTELHTQMKSVN